MPLREPARILDFVALSLKLPPNYFEEGAMRDPLVLFRIFNYPVPKESDVNEWGVGEHTDYGFLTVLKWARCFQV